MPEGISQDRRLFLRASPKTIAAAELAVISPAEAQSRQGAMSDVMVAEPGTSPAFDLPKQIDGDILSIGYLEAGSADGRTVILLHGWHYDICSHVEVLPLLVSKGYRLIVPYLRGYGPTGCRFSDLFQYGQLAALASDVVALMDALKIPKATIAGFDWGAQAAKIVAAFWSERCRGMVFLSGYLISSPDTSMIPLQPMPSVNGGSSFIFHGSRDGRV